MWVSGPPEVHHELLGLFSIEQQVVGVAPLSQTIQLLPVVSLLFLMRPITVVSSVNSRIETVDWFAVMGEKRKGLVTQPCGAPVFMVMADEQRSSSRTCRGRLVRKSSHLCPVKGGGSLGINVQFHLCSGCEGVLSLGLWSSSVGGCCCSVPPPVEKQQS